MKVILILILIELSHTQKVNHIKDRKSRNGNIKFQFHVYEFNWKLSTFANVKTEDYKWKREYKNRLSASSLSYLQTHTCTYINVLYRSLKNLLNIPNEPHKERKIQITIDIP